MNKAHMTCITKVMEFHIYCIHMWVGYMDINKKKKFHHDRNIFKSECEYK